MNRVRMIAKGLFVAGLLALADPTLAEITYYVKLDGDDAKSGTSAAEAFATLARARDAIRQRQPLNEDVVVNILPGTYFVKETIELTDKDSAPDGRRIIYRAADAKNKPRISGGRAIGGSWKAQKDGIFSIDAGEGDFRQLYVNGQLATSAREPDVGEWRAMKQWEPLTNSLRLQGTGIMGHWARFEQVEMVVKKHWAMSRIHFKGWGTYDGDDVLFLKNPGLELKQAHVPPKENGQFYFFENALEFLDQPGEWHLDRKSRKLYCKPRAGEDLAKAEIIVPRLERLVDMKGAANITFDGLAFEHGNWLRANGDNGYAGAQCNVHWDGWQTNPGAIHLTGTNGIRFLNGIFRNTTGAALVLVKGTQKTHIEGNAFTCIGDTPIAVYAEKEKKPAESDQCRDDVIRNNFINGFGRENCGASGICVSVATRITVEHNEVMDGGYAGITYGYFSEHESPAAGSRVQFNHIHHVMKEVDDGAGIYIFVTKFDRSDSTLLVQRNFIHDVVRLPFTEDNPIAGIYLDEGASSVTLRQNVIRNVGNTIHHNTGNAGKDNETRPDRQVFDGNTDADPEVEKLAGLQPEYAHLNPNLTKPEPKFEPAVLVHHWPLDGNLNDIAGGKHGTLRGGASFDAANRAIGSAALLLDGKNQYASLPELELPNRFAISFWVQVPEKAFGERAVFGSTGLKFYSAVDIGQFKELVRADVVDPKGKSTAATPNGTLPRGQWHHVLLTIDRWHGAQRLYIDGRDATWTDYMKRMNFPAQNAFDLGRYSENEPRCFTGSIDDFRIYHGHPRMAQIQALAGKR